MSIVYIDNPRFEVDFREFIPLNSKSTQANLSTVERIQTLILEIFREFKNAVYSQDYIN
jgi:hypothetical protein